MPVTSDLSARSPVPQSSY